MRVVVVGLGVQGSKRLPVASAAGDVVVATVDAVHAHADYRNVKEVPADAYDAALVCVPDAAKLDVVGYLLDRGKHVLVEKPLLSTAEPELERLQALARRRNAVCYTAYNHRFEPHFERMSALIASGELGRVFLVRLFYGNGTARDVRGAWRDRGAGVLVDLGSHLLDTVCFWLGPDICTGDPVTLQSARRFENNAFDYAVIGGDGEPALQLEMSLVSWRNEFRADVVGERGSAHIDSLCKWGPATFRHRTRVLPSGRPPETCEVLVRSDPTWQLEYAHFRALCARAAPADLTTDIWIDRTLRALARPSGEGAV